MPLSPGASFGRYTIQALLGQGGMGVVYRAHDAHLDRTVALKVLRAEAEVDPGARETAAQRLLREGRAAAAIQHPNAVAIFDVGEWEGTTFMAMELVEGRTLRSHIGDERVPLARRARWLLEIAAALAAAHRRGIVHRDVKPENVIVGEDASVKVLDFGIARRATAGAPALDGSQKDSTVFGSPRYMAPEQLRGEPLDGRTDQFAWGIVAFELLTGRHPWEHVELDLELAKCILGREIPAPSTSNPALPEEIDRLVRRCVEKAPERRLESMDAAIARLRAIDLGPDTPSDATADGTQAPDAGTFRFGRVLRSITTRTFGMTARLGTGAGGAGTRAARWLAGIGVVMAVGTAGVYVVRGGRRTEATEGREGTDARAIAASAPEGIDDSGTRAEPDAIAPDRALRPEPIALPEMRDAATTTPRTPPRAGTRPTPAQSATQGPDAARPAASSPNGPPLNTEW